MTARFLEPSPFRAYQRRGFRFADAHADTAQPAAMGNGTVALRLTTDDPEGRVAAYDPTRGTWRVAHDPQPTVRPRGLSA